MIEANPLETAAWADLHRAANTVLVACHASTGIASRCDGPAPVQHVVCRTLGPSRGTFYFDSREDGELSALARLREFVSRRVEAGPTTWLHWNQRVDCWADRYRRLAGSDEFQWPEDRLDLSSAFPRIYGPDYAGGHPRFLSLLSLNGINGRGLLTEDEAAQAFARGDFPALRVNSERKAGCAGHLFELALRRELKTAGLCGLAGDGAPDSTDYGFGRTPGDVAAAWEAIWHADDEDLPVGFSPDRKLEGHIDEIARWCNYGVRPDCYKPNLIKASAEGRIHLVGKRRRGLRAVFFRSQQGFENAVKRKAEFGC